MKAPKPGIYKGVAFDEYRSWDAVNNSSLSELEKSPKHYKAGLETPRKETPALKLGRLIHTALLEPDEFKKAFVGVDEGEFEKNCMVKDKKTKELVPASSPKSTSQYKQNVVEWYLSIPRLVLKPDQREFEKVRGDLSLPSQIEWLAGVAKRTKIDFAQYEQINAMCEAMKSTDGYEKLRNGTKEVSFVWVDPTTGILCKGRCDALTKYLFADLKSTEDGHDWEWSLWKFHYHRQAAFYQDGLAIVGDGELLPAWYCVVEKNPPYDCRIAPVNDHDIVQGREEYQASLAIIAECRNTGEWPGVGNPDEWRIPEAKRSYSLTGADGEPLKLGA